MITLTFGILQALRCRRSQGSARCFQVRAAPFLAGFKVISLGPLIPRVDKDERLRRDVLIFALPHEARSSLDNLAKPALVKFRRGIYKNVRALPSARTVVP